MLLARRASDRLAYILLFLYAFFTVLFPVLIFNKVIFAPLFLWSVYYFLRGGVLTVAPFVIFGVFLLGYLSSFSSEIDEGLALQMILSTLSLFIIYLVSGKGLTFNFIFKIVGLLLAFSASFFSLILLMYPSSFVAASFLSFYTGNDLGFYGVRDFGGLNIFMLHHRSSPFLIVPLCLFLGSYFEEKRLRNLIAFAIVAIAIVLSASRALMLLGLVATFFVCIASVSRMTRLLMLLFAGFILAICGYYLVFETDVFSLSETSNSIKIGHFISFLDNFNARILLVGEGLGSYYFSLGRAEYIAQTEITVLDSVRYFGLPLSIIVFTCLMFPMLHKTIRMHGLLSLVFTLYFLMSLTNPVLFNSFGFLVVLWYWADYINANKSKTAAIDGVVLFSNKC